VLQDTLKAQATPAAGLRVEEVQAMMQRLLQLAQDDDPESLELAYAVKDAGSVLGRGQQFAAIVQAIQAYDFDAAKALIAAELEVLTATGT
jgi:hypothetical protein